MKDKKSFVLYSDYKELFEELSSSDAGDLIKHILRYVNDENPETENPIVRVSFIPIKRQLKRDLEKYEDKKKQWSDAGKASAAKRKESIRDERSLTSVDSVATVSTVNGTVNDTVNVNETKERFSAFWDLYNKKVSRSSCERIWNKLKESDRDAILYTLPSFLETITDKQYQPHPKTYLNQRRWEDVIDKSDGKPPQMKQENWDKLDSWQQESIRAGIAL